MKQFDPQKVEEIFYAALELSADRRAHFLSEECGDDAGLREEVASLLDSYRETFLEKNVSEKALQLIRGVLMPGDVLSDRYEIVEMIGDGGMGEVYLAEDAKLKRPVAVKVLAEKFTQDKKRVESFKKEALAASRINHRNILTVYDFVDEGSTSFIVTKFIPGETLRKKLQSGPLDLPSAMRITCAMASALEAAHANGVVHRDIKPENVIINDEGHVIILDFGIAKLTEREPPEDEPAPRALSRAEAASGFGTANYMSPEQVRALDREQDVDKRSDIWSLGVCLYEMLTGAEPFKGETRIETFAAILKDEPVQPGQNVPAGLKAVIHKALQKNRDDRYQTMLEFRSSLEGVAPQTGSRPMNSDGAMGTFKEWRKSSGNIISQRFVICASLCLMISLAFTVYFLFLENLSGVEINEAWTQMSDENSELSQRKVPREEIEKLVRGRRAARTVQAVGSIFHLIIICIAVDYFRRHPGPKAFRRLEDDIEHGRLLPNITYSTGYKDVSDWKTARSIAKAALEDYREYFKWLLIAWMFLYFWTLVNLFSEGHFITISVLTLANNLNTLCIWLCFHILNEPITTESKTQTHQGIKVTESLKGPRGLLPAVFGMMIWLVLQLVLTSRFEAQAESIHQFSKLISGIFGGVAMALFVGRFQSKFLKLPDRLISILYLYTVIQALFIFYGGQSVKEEWWAAAVFHAALFLKCLLILYIFWLFQSGRLLFYLVRVRRASDQVDSEWRNFREVLQQEG
jgi:serine/threonine protein kinase